MAAKPGKSRVSTSPKVRSGGATWRSVLGPGLVILTVVVFLPVLGHGFVHYDDQMYVTENPQVRSGVTWSGVIWAMTAEVAANWHPLTLLSHMLDVSLFGLRHVWGHHLVSVLLHAASAWALFQLLARSTGTHWRSAVVAALFAIHPLHVESVVWVAERKDVLSGLFWFLTLLAYVRYAEAPRVTRYLPVVLLFACGLASKPMVVTLPFVMTLMDYWPLGRLQRDASAMGWPKSLVRAALEKAPLFVLTCAASLITLRYQHGASAVASVSALPVSLRMENAVVAYLRYLAKAVWPFNLAVFYPHYEHALPLWEALGAGVVLAAITAYVVYWRRSRPYMIVGWLWYIGTLVPVIGLVQVGDQAMADRYTYLPLVGVFIAVVWGVADVWRRPLPRDGKAEASKEPGQRVLAPAVLAAVVIAGLCLITVRQISFWSDDIALFTRALEVTGPNHVVDTILGGVLIDKGEAQDALPYLERAVSERENYPLAQLYLADALSSTGRGGEALDHYAKAIALAPKDVRARNSLGKALLAQKRIDEAAQAYSGALTADPRNLVALLGIARCRAEAGKSDEAAQSYEDIVRWYPNSAEAHSNYGGFLARLGRYPEAIAQFERAIESQPGNPSIHFNLAMALERSHNPEGAKAELQRALEIDPGFGRARNELNRLSN